MTRKGHTNSNATSFGTMDNLIYTYETNSNKLQKVVDNGNHVYGFKEGANNPTEYTYDANGNMKTDANKGISNISYNHLNLPTVVTINGQNINYTYDAAGTKLRKVVSGVTTDYAGNYIYTNNALQFFNHPEGYVKNDNGTFNYVYQYKDHLGNVRLSYSDADGNGVITAATEIVEESNYYPFGLKHKGYNNVTNGGNVFAQKYGFTGKEHQDELGLGWIDITARNYDAALGRWMNLDPLAEQMRRHSPYNYAFNNPIFFIDPDGMAPREGGIDWSGHNKYYDKKDDDPDPEPTAITRLKEIIKNPVLLFASLFKSKKRPKKSTTTNKEKTESTENTESYTGSGIDWFGSSHTLSVTQFKNEKYPFGQAWQDKVSFSFSTGVKEDKSGVFNLVTKTNESGTSYSGQIKLGKLKGSVGFKGLGITASGGFGDTSFSTAIGFDYDFRPYMSNIITKTKGKKTYSANYTFKPGYGTATIVAGAAVLAASGGAALIPALGF